MRRRQSGSGLDLRRFAVSPDALLPFLRAGGDRADLRVHADYGPARMTAAAHIPTAAPPAGYDGPRRSLILAGGGMRVAYQAGVVRALIEAGLHFDHADGTSGGTMNLAMLLSGLSAEEMCERWRTLDVNDFVTLLPLRMYARGPADLPALGGAEGVVKRVFPHLGIDIGRIRDANLGEALHQGSDEIWVVWCIGNMGEYLDGAFNQYVHMIELSANGNLFKELEQIAELNRKRPRPIRVHVIRPEYPLPLDPDYYKGHIDGATLVDRGYRDAASYLAT